MNRFSTRLNVQFLEARDLQATALTASLDASGVLSVIGSSGSDRVQVIFDNNVVQVFDWVAVQPVPVRVAATGQTLPYLSRAMVNNADPNCGIRIACNAGDDQVWVSENAANPALRLSVDGGIGKDSLTGGSAADVLNGGADDDALTGGGGNDTLQGSTGTDTLCEDVTGWAVLTNNKYQIGDLNIGGPKTPAETDVTANFEKVRLRFTNANANADASGFSGAETLLGPTGYEIALAKGQAMPHRFRDLGSDILARYQALGGPTGALGLPYNDATAIAPRGVPGRFVTFEHGMICQLNGGPAVAITGTFYAKWIALGGLVSKYGVPTSDVYTAATGVSAVNFQYGAMYYQSKLLGPKMVEGAILGKYLALGGPGGGLGAPTSDELTAANGVGRYSTFRGGRLSWTPTTDTHLVYGAILDHYVALGAEGSNLGAPTSDEMDAPGGGRVNYFQNGAIFWSNDTGAHAITGEHYGKFMKYGGIATFGYPTSDVYRTEYGDNSVGLAVGYSIDFTRGFIGTNGHFGTTWEVMKRIDGPPYWFKFEFWAR